MATYSRHNRTNCANKLSRKACLILVNSSTVLLRTMHVTQLGSTCALVPHWCDEDEYVDLAFSEVFGVKLFTVFAFYGKPLNDYENTDNEN